MTDDLDIGSHDGSGSGEEKSFQGADPLDSGSDDGSNGGNGKSPQSADPLDFGAIEAAVNEAAKRLNTVWVTFILLMTYLLITTGKITHKDLFLETPVKLPILNVDVPLLGYFIAAPVFILAVHFYFLIQLSGLAVKFGEYDATLSELPNTEHGQVKRLRHRIDNSLFAQAIGGPTGGADFILRFIALMTAAILPIFLLLFISLTFLPYQDVRITWIHRLLVLTDVALVLAYVVGTGRVRVASFWMRLGPKPPPKTDGQQTGLWPGARRAFSGARTFVEVACLGVALLLVPVFFWFSYFVALLPSEPWPFPQLTQSFFAADVDAVRQGPSSWFSNRLILPDQNLIEGFDLDKTKITRSLRGRHFVGAIFDRADLRHVDFTSADLSFASLQGAKLEKAQFGCAYGTSSVSGCTKLPEARLDGAEMQDASLFGANMMGASLYGANLERASLFNVQLEGASLEYARLTAANLSYARMDGTSLSRADLTATLFSYARMRGADFTNAQMFGATLDWALAQGASFENAHMQGASLQGVNFSGAKFYNTSVYGADVSEAQLKSALIKDVSSSRRWPPSVGGSYPNNFEPLYTKDNQSDPFGKEGDIVDYNSSYYDLSSESSVEIPVAEQDRLHALFPDGLSQDESGTEIKKRLARLAPDSKTADWTKLTDKPISEDEYIKGLGERLIIIACAKEGEGHVARGLIRNKRLCPYQKEVEATLNSGLLPNGKACADAQNFKQIWNEAMQASAVCQQNAGSPPNK